MNTRLLMVQLTLVLGAGWIAGLLARAARLPVLVGFILAGLVIGPHTPGWAANRDIVENVANLGVVFLMFSVGMQLSLDEMAEVRKEAVWGGLAQIILTVALGVGLSVAMGWTVSAGLVVGCAIALSSTAVMVRVLEERGELGSAHGRIILGILVVQDLAVIAMAVLLPLLGPDRDGSGGLKALVLGIGRAGLFIGAVILLASRVVPAFLRMLVRMRSRELLLLGCVFISIGSALAAEAFGVELALGAFMAGLVISESEYADEVLSQIRPLRDVFASVFFVSVGMLLDPAFVLRHWWQALALILAVMVGKSLIATLAVRATGRHLKTSLQVGFGLGQIGEFSFVLGGIGVSAGVLAQESAGLLLAAAVVTIVATPLLSSAGGRIYQWMARNPLLASRVAVAPEPKGEDMEYGCGDARVLLLGYGRVGRSLSETLRRQGIPHTVVEYDPIAARAAHQAGLPVVHGDASSEAVVAKALTPCLELVLVALPEAPTAEVVVRSIRLREPTIPILVRVHREEDVAPLLAAGANSAIYAESLAAVEMARQAQEILHTPLEPQHAAAPAGG